MDHLVEALPWDTEFFGLPIGRLRTNTLGQGDGARLRSQARELGLRLVYVSLDPEDPLGVAEIEAAGGHQADVRIVLESPLRERPSLAWPVPTDIGVEVAARHEATALESLARQVGEQSRFAFDRRLPAGSCNRLYDAWIHRAFDGYADQVLVARLASPSTSPPAPAVGLLVWASEPEGLGIQLAGVAREQRGRGVGTALVQRVLEIARSRGAPQVRVATQARNVPAQRLYQQMGFFTREVTLLYHLWLAPTGAEP